MTFEIEITNYLEFGPFNLAFSLIFEFLFVVGACLSVELSILFAFILAFLRSSSEHFWIIHYYLISDVVTNKNIIILNMHSVRFI